MYKRIAGLLMVLVLVAVSVAPAGAEQGDVNVTATASSKLVLELSTNAVNFGTNLDPAGTDSSASGVTDFIDGENGAVYVAYGASSTYAVTVRVSSNTAWSGSVVATENSGTAGMSIANGDLRWKLGDIASLNDALAATAFSTTADEDVFDTATQCDIGETLQAGNCTYSFDYALKVQWTDDPGTFASVVTYQASQ